MVSLFAQALVALVIGHPTPFQCVTWLDPHAGWYDGTTIWLSQAQVCDELTANEVTQNPWLFAYSALAVTHEAEHAAGIVDEHAANCKAVADLPKVLAAVGIARAPAKVIWKHARSLARGMPAPYGGACA